MEKQRNEKLTFLEMYLCEELLDAVPLNPIELRANCHKHIKRLKEELLKKHRPALSKAEIAPCFILSGVPSRINDFVPLGAPGN